MEPGPGELLRRKERLKPAPMTLTEVDGDFAVIVQVAGEFEPGSTLPKDLTRNDISSTTQGAGLYLYHDKDNFVRLERTASVELDTLRPVHLIFFQAVQDGKQLARDSFPLPEGPIYLILIRRNGRVAYGAASDLRALRGSLGGKAFILPPKVKIGLSASSMSARPFIPTFENFAILDDVALIDAVFAVPTK